MFNNIIAVDIDRCRKQAEMGVAQILVLSGKVILDIEDQVAFKKKSL